MCFSVIFHCIACGYISLHIVYVLNEFYFVLSIFFFFFEAYCIVVFLILPFITSHKAFGFASTLLVAVSLIVFSICS